MLFRKVQIGLRNPLERKDFFRIADLHRIELVMQIGYGFHCVDGTDQRKGLRHIHQRLSEGEDRRGLNDYCRWMMDGGEAPQAALLDFSRLRPAVAAVHRKNMDMHAPYGYFPVEQLRSRALMNLEVVGDEAQAPFLEAHEIGGPYSPVAKRVIAGL